MTVQAVAAPVRIPGLPRLRWLWAAAGVLALLAAALLGVLVGPAHISPAAVLQALTGSSIDPGQATAQGRGLVVHDLALGKTRTGRQGLPGH